MRWDEYDGCVGKQTGSWLKDTRYCTYVRMYIQLCSTSLRNTPSKHLRDGVLLFCSRGNLLILFVWSYKYVCAVYKHVISSPSVMCIMGLLCTAMDLTYVRYIRDKVNVLRPYM